MEFYINQAIALLKRTPNILRAIFQELPTEWINNNEGNDSWSPYDVLGHLIHAERTDWIPRTKMILKYGEDKIFQPFDRYAQFQESNERSVEELIEIFSELRQENIKTLQEMKLTPEDLKRVGSHPEFGRVTLEQLLATWVVHDQTHLVQINRTIAKQYQQTVGPWKAYLSVLK